MRTKHVVVLPYDEKWKQDFIDIKTELSQALGELAISIEHVVVLQLKDWRLSQL